MWRTTIGSGLRHSTSCLILILLLGIKAATPPLVVRFVCVGTRQGIMGSPSNGAAMEGPGAFAVISITSTFQLFLVESAVVRASG